LRLFIRGKKRGPAETGNRTGDYLQLCKTTGETDVKGGRGVRLLLERRLMAVKELTFRVWVSSASFKLGTNQDVSKPNVVKPESRRPLSSDQKTLEKEKSLTFTPPDESGGG